MAAPIDGELQALKDNLIDMLEMVRGQVDKCRKALHKSNLKYAEEVLSDEEKINQQEIAIDRDCENILALYTPVATDLRFVLSTLKIANNLERIGDYAKSFARFVIDRHEHISPKLFARYNIPEMLDTLAKMLKDMREAVNKGDTRLARKTTTKDLALNEYFREAFATTTSLMSKKPEKSALFLSLFAITRDLERGGDHTKNIAEELVFHIEAKVVKHRKG